MKHPREVTCDEIEKAVFQVGSDIKGGIIWKSGLWSVRIRIDKIIDGGSLMAIETNFFVGRRRAADRHTRIGHNVASFAINGKSGHIVPCSEVSIGGSAPPDKAREYVSIEGTRERLLSLFKGKSQVCQVSMSLWDDAHHIELQKLFIELGKRVVDKRIRDDPADIKMTRDDLLEERGLAKVKRGGAKRPRRRRSAKTPETPPASSRPRRAQALGADRGGCGG